MTNSGDNTDPNVVNINIDMQNHKFRVNILALFQIFHQDTLKNLKSNSLGS